MSALESLHFLTERRHPTVIEILILLRKLERKGFHIIFSWVPGHVGILGNEQADTAARSMSDHMQRPVCYQDLKTFQQNYIHRVVNLGCGSLVVKVSDRGWHVTSSSPVPLKTRRVGEQCMLNLSRAQTSSRWCGVLFRRVVPAQVSSSSLDRGLKLRCPSPKALV
ncbi:uncharacterized protein TNCV_1189101 [Trichonephila clavipes]|nr:uncharacterized protein TNCV_1189101 [Trichonephila clavipes]